MRHDFKKPLLGASSWRETKATQGFSQEEAFGSHATTGRAPAHSSQRIQQPLYNQGDRAVVQDCGWERVSRAPTSLDLDNGTELAA